MAVPTSSDCLRPLRVFVVEDHPDTLHSLCLYLKNLGYDVQCAGTFGEALTAIPQAACDVLLSDISLGDSTGWTLLHVLRLQGQAPDYAIAMSGLGLYVDQRRSLEAGFRHHLRKPFRPEELGAFLEEAALEARAAAC